MYNRKKGVTEGTWDTGEELKEGTRNDRKTPVHERTDRPRMHEYIKKYNE